MVYKACPKPTKDPGFSPIFFVLDGIFIILPVLCVTYQNKFFHVFLKRHTMPTKSVCLVFGKLLFLLLLIQNIFAVDEDEFYCKSKAGKYKFACKRCINNEDCDYNNETLSKFKSCYCSNLELVNSTGGLYIIFLKRYMLIYLL